MVEGRKNGLGVWEWFSRRLKRRKMGGFWLSCSDSSSKKKFLEKNSFEHLIWPINNQWSFQNCCFCSLAAFFTRPKPENTLRQRGSELRDGANMAGMISIGKFMGNPLKMEVLWKIHGKSPKDGGFYGKFMGNPLKMEVSSWEERWKSSINGGFFCKPWSWWNQNGRVVLEAICCTCCHWIKTRYLWRSHGLSFGNSTYTLLVNVYIKLMGKSPCYEWLNQLFRLGHFQ